MWFKATNQTMILTAVDIMIVPTKTKRSFIFLKLISIIIALVIFTGSAIGATPSIKLLEGVANPGEIPNFDDFYAPTITPGTTGKLRFTITNRYEFNYENSNTMSNVTLTVNIYRYKTLEETKDISKIKNGPRISSGNDALQTIQDRSTAIYYWSELVSNQTVPVELSIKSSGDTPQGTYFVRMHLDFIFNNTIFSMKSRGHFTNQQWENAQPNATDSDEYPIVGRLNLQKLGVNGIIPDTSFRVKPPIPTWPLYLAIAGVIICVILAGVFYLMDEKGKFPKAKKKLDDVGERLERFRYRRE